MTGTQVLPSWYARDVNSDKTPQNLDTDPCVPPLSIIMQRHRQLRRLTSHEREFKHHRGWSDNAGYLYNGRHVAAATAGTQRYAADANNSQVCFDF